MRTLNAEALALIDASVSGAVKIGAVYLLFIDFDVPQRWAIAGRDLVWSGYTWTKRDIEIEPPEDSTGEVSGLKIMLPAVTESERALAVDPGSEGAAVELRVALVDLSTGVVADAMLAWKGEIDIPGWQFGAESTAHFNAEHLAIIAMRPRPSRYTNDEQQRLYPGDTCLDFDPATDAGRLVWPAAGFFKV